MLELSWHFDFHSHRQVNIGTRPDPRGVAAALADACVTEIITFAKGHCGYTYYPTDLKTCYRHPKMVGDPFGDIVRHVKDADIRVLAYISFGIDGEGARHNPHWRQVFKEGPQESPDWFICVCPFTRYTEDCVLPQIDEIVRRYPVDGFFFDTMAALGACYCDTCRAQFRKEHGLEIPRDEDRDEQAWGVYGRFRHDRGMKLLDRVSAFIQEKLPGAAVGFNQVGSPPYPEPMPAGCTRLTLDFPTNGRQSRHASRCAAYGSLAPQPADVMPTIFNCGWGDWSLAPAERLEQVTAAIWARRCNVYIGDRLHPQNRLAQPTVQALRQIKAIRTRLSEHFPPDEARLTPDVVILHSRSGQYGPDYRDFALARRERQQMLMGAADLLLDSGENHTVAAEHFLENALPTAGVAILPEMQTIEPETDKLLRRFLERGGQVLLVGCVPKVGDEPVAWAGVTQEHEPWQDHLYLPGDAQTGPVLVRGQAMKLHRSGAEMVQRAIAPLDMRYGVRFGWGISPPCDAPCEHPVLTRHAVGDRGGAAWTLGAPLFSAYDSTGCWQHVAYLRSLMRRVLPKPAAHLRSPFGQVEVVLHRDDSTAWAVLVNHGGEQLSGVSQWPRTWGPLPAYDVQVVLRDPRRRSPRAAKVNGQPVALQREDDGAVSVPVKMDAAWKVARVDWEK